LRAVLDDQELWSVNLFQEFALAAATEIDLYLPSHPHLSTRGYRIMSNAISLRIKEYAFAETGNVSGGRITPDAGTVVKSNSNPVPKSH